MAVATYNPTLFHARYPEFANVSDVVLASLFSEAGLYLNNTDGSPVQDVNQRTTLLNMLTAHIAYIGGLLAADGQALPVGRVSTASEGSVSASFDYTPCTPGSGAWFKQSQYGAAFWPATSYIRSAIYIPKQCPPVYFY